MVEHTPAGEYKPYRAFLDVFRIFKFDFKLSLEFVAFFVIVGFLIFYGYMEINQARHCKRITGSFTLYATGEWNH